MKKSYFKFKIFLLHLIFAFITLSSYGTAFSEDELLSIIATDFPIDDKVVRLNLPYEGIKFKILWQTLEGKIHDKDLVSRKGVHAYEMRDNPAWTRTPAVVAVYDIPVISGEIKIPAFEDELDMFLAPELLTPKTVNSLYGHTFLSGSWNRILILLMLFSSFILYVWKRKNPVVMLFIGFVIAWGVMDIRTMYDHFCIADRIEDNAYINLTKHINKEGERLGKEIGNWKWTQKNLPWPERNLIPYMLADHKYAGHYKPNTETDFLITFENNRLVLVENIGK
jgi:hypothetical protein